ncbi:MAG: ribosome silencing factor [Candidatus Nanopelagicaceae bacterium]
MPVSDLVRKELDVAAQAAVDKLGTDLVAIDLSEQSLLSEAFLIVTGQNPRQVEAIADEIEEKLKGINEKPVRRENGEEWILIDYSDLVVHIQSENLRRYYMLDRLWNDCPTIPLHVNEAR